MSTPLDSAVKDSQIFSSLDDAQLEQILAVMPERDVDAGQSLFRQGDAGTTMILVMSGELVIEFTQKNGRKFELGRVLPGGILGELSFLDPAARTATASAVTKTVIREIDRARFKALFTTAPDVASVILNVLMDLVLKRSEELRSRISKSMIERRSESAVRPKTHRRSLGELVSDALNEPLPNLPAGFDMDTLRQLAKFCPCRAYPMGTSFYEEGERAESCILIIQGKVRVFRLSEETDDQEYALATVEQGGMVGQTALFSESNRAAAVHAISSVTVIEITREDFARVLETKDHLALTLQERLVIDGIQQHRNILQRLNKIGRLADASVAPTKPEEPEQRPSNRPSTDQTEIITDGVTEFRQQMLVYERQKTEPSIPPPPYDDTRQTDPIFETTSLSQELERERMMQDYAVGITEWSISFDEHDES